ncbi:MAG: CDP-alcohol phosphatidyltransferase family protein [Dehalococcoidales bacterium]|nr:CDP-alcohol phosphatidyltransferase family protein [Dehalococcoidales bacterium]MDP6632804.1 CDP-alcohol phosphatidyltransferase family protein [Dehalococcoidales bacterium]
MDNQTFMHQKQRPVTKRAEFRKTAEDYLTRLVVRLLAKTPVTPNAMTWIGFSITLGAGVLIITEHLLAAGFVVLFAGFFDMLDGALARGTDRVTRFGAILDSTLDRFSEAALLLSVLSIYAVRATEQSTPVILIVGFALVGSLLVSYIRAKAEAMGLECTVGFFTRPERVVVLAIGLMLSRINYAFLVAALSIIVLFSFITVSQRLLHVWRQTKN